MVIFDLQNSKDEPFFSKYHLENGNTYTQDSVLFTYNLFL